MSKGLVCAGVVWRCGESNGTAQAGACKRVEAGSEGWSGEASKAR